MNTPSLLRTLRTIKSQGFTPQVRENFSKDELLVISRILEEWDDSGSSPTLDALWEVDFEEKPVSVQEFLEDDYYLGKVGRSLYDVWRTDLQEVLSPSSVVLEWVLRGSIGSGKSYTAVVALVYKLYFLLCLRNPQDYCGIADGTPIVFALFNIYKYLAQATTYQYLTTWLRDMSPFFAHIRGDHLSSKRQLSDKQVLKLPKGITIALGSAAINALGQNTLFAIMDEADFGKSKSVTSQNKSQMADLYTNIKSRLESRFMQKGGHNPGLLCLVSSMRDTEAFLSKHIKNATERTKISSYALYEAQSHKYSESPTFTVVIGDKLHRSYILEDEGEDAEPREGATTIKVPIEFLEAFRLDIDEAIRNIAGMETYGSTLFLPQRDRLLACLDRSTPRSHPFGKHEIALSIYDSVTIEDYFRPEDLVEVYDKSLMIYRPRFHPYADRYVHVDLAKSGDCAGLAMTCISETVHIERINRAGMKVRARDYIHFVDFMLRIRAVQGSEIDFSKIRQFLFFLATTCNFKIRWISYDSYQSTDSIQIFKKEGFQSKELSVDRTPGPYRVLKSIIHELRLDYYEYPPFYDEITKLEDHTSEGGKIDHPDSGSKDVADSVAGSIAGTLLAKGRQITGSDAHDMLVRSQYYAEQKPKDFRETVKKEAKAGNPLDSLYE